MEGILAETFAKDTFAYLPGPYHFLADFETFTSDGRPDGQGTIEKFFVAPGRVKVITRFRDHAMTAWHADEKSAWMYKDDGFDGTIMTYMVNDFLLNPLPPPMGTARKDLETKVFDFKGSTMDCGTFQFFIAPPGWPPLPKEALCVNRDTHDLVLRQTERFSIQYEQFAPFLGRSIPRYIVGTQGPVVRCRIRMESVDQTIPDDVAMTVPADASRAMPGPNWLSLAAKEAQPTHNAVPVWPSGVKAAGPVMLLVLISRTGAVKDMEVQYTASPEFAQAGMDAVRKWRYAPVIRDGKPVETITTVNLSFGKWHLPDSPVGNQ
jgi:TonB-like protein